MVFKDIRHAVCSARPYDARRLLFGKWIGKREKFNVLRKRLLITLLDNREKRPFHGWFLKCPKTENNTIRTRSDL